MYNTTTHYTFAAMNDKTEIERLEEEILAAQDELAMMDDGEGSAPVGGVILLEGGEKAASRKATVPTQIRILQSQLDELKVITALDRTNVSSVVRSLIAQYIETRRADKRVRTALNAASSVRHRTTQLTNDQCIQYGVPLGSKVVWKAFVEPK